MIMIDIFETKNKAILKFTLLPNFNTEYISTMFLPLIIQIHQLTSGIYPNIKIAMAATIIMRIFIVIAFGGIIIAVFATNEASYRTIILGLLSCITFSSSLQLITKFHESFLIKVTQKLRQNTFSFTNRKINDEAEREMERKFWPWIVILMTSCSTPIFCPYFYFITKTEISYDDPDLQIIPFFLAYWKTNTFIEYSGMVILQLSIIGTMTIAYWSFAIYTIYVVVHLQKHVQTLNEEFIKVLNLYFERHFEEHFVTSNGHGGESSNAVFIRKRSSQPLQNSAEFINIIKYQQFIHSYIDDFVKFINKPYTSVFTWFIYSTIVFAYSFLQVVGDAVFIIKNLSMVFHGILALYLFCNAAQIVNHLNESIMDAFYHTEWYYMPPNIRKSLITIFIQSQRKYEIRSFSMYIVNLNLFLYSLRIVYSALNVLLMMQKK